jgi:hypothetical protein
MSHNNNSMAGEAALPPRLLASVVSGPHAHDG